MIISIRPIPNAFQNIVIPAEAVAIDRAGDSDIALCSVAIDPLGRAWARAEYVLDQVANTLTVYPGADIERKRIYANLKLWDWLFTTFNLQFSYYSSNTFVPAIEVMLPQFIEMDHCSRNYPQQTYPDEIAIAASPRPGR